MAKRLQHRGGTTAQHSTFTGAVREVTVDTDKNTLVVHDGATAGGHPLATATNFTSTGIDDNATSTAITIQSDGDVGIGTTNPSFSSGKGLRIQNSGTATLRLQDDGVHGFEIRASSTEAQFSSANGKPFTFTTNSSERMRLDYNGGTRLFVGTTSDVSHGVAENNRLIVSGFSGDGAGMIGFQDTSGNTDGTITVGNGSMTITADTENTTASSSLNFRVDNNEKMRIDSSGNVGIGTSSPSGKLHLKSSSGSLLQYYDSASGQSTLYFRDTSSNVKAQIEAQNDGTMWLTTRQTAPIQFGINNSEKMRINPSGNVGIGTTSPTAKLDVTETIQIDNTVTIGGSAFTGEFDIQINNLITLTGNQHKRYGLRLSFAGIVGNLTGSQYKDVLIAIGGLSIWSAASVIDTGGGTIAVTVTSSSSTSMNIRVTTPASNCVGAYVATLFATGNATMICYG